MAKRKTGIFSRPLLIGVVIALILTTTAVLKWLFPPVRDPLLYFIVGGIEVILAVALVVFYRSWRIWMFLTLMLVTWSGFSFYTTLFGVPCSCLGAALNLPRGIPLALNGFMLAGAWFVLDRDQSYSVKFKKLIPFLILFFIIGFASAVVYYNLI